MNRTLKLTAKSNIDTAMRVMATIRRKQLDILEFNLINHDEISDIYISVVDDDVNLNFLKLTLLVEKLADVYNIEEMKEA